MIGSLGVALGRATEIDAVVISGRDLRRKGFDSLYLLKVTHVGGKKLDKPTPLRFSVPSFISVELASHNFSLYEMKHGKRLGV